MHPDYSNLEDALLKKMRLLKQEDDLFNASKALHSMIIFLNGAKDVAANQNSKYEDLLRWFDCPEYRFFAEVESLKDLLNEYKNSPKP